MRIDLSSWLWWRLLSVVMAIVVWLLLAFGVGAVPLSARQGPAGQLGFEAAGQGFTVGPHEGRLDWIARRFDAAITCDIEEGQM